MYTRYSRRPAVTGHASRGSILQATPVAVATVNRVSGSCRNESRRYRSPWTVSSLAGIPVFSLAYAVLGNGKP